MKNCLICNGEFKERAVGTTREKKCCSAKCKKVLDSRIQYSKGIKKQLSETNRELYNELVMNDYKKNKHIWFSRTLTNRTLSKLLNINQILKKECKECRDKNDLEIHHEIYPTKTLEIIDSILENKIYYLCSKCHAEKRKIKFGENLVTK